MVQMTTDEYKKFKKLSREREIKETYTDADIIIELLSRVEKLEKKIAKLAKIEENQAAKAYAKVIALWCIVEAHIRTGGKDENEEGKADY